MAPFVMIPMETSEAYTMTGALTKPDIVIKLTVYANAVGITEYFDIGVI